MLLCFHPHSFYANIIYVNLLVLINITQNKKKSKIRNAISQNFMGSLSIFLSISLMHLIVFRNKLFNFTTQVNSLPLEARATPIPWKMHFKPFAIFNLLHFFMQTTTTTTTIILN